jgi:hypothetical protein
MRRHNGMRPQDVVILMKILTLEGQPWRMKDLSISLRISASEVSESLERSALAGLIALGKAHVMRDNLLEFLVHGIRYVFPAQYGPVTHGLATAHSASPLKAEVLSQETIVWPWPDGPDRGSSIVPLIPTVPMVAASDPKLYAMLALIESLRAGHVRERKLAAQHLEKLIWSTPIMA